MSASYEAAHRARMIQRARIPLRLAIPVTSVMAVGVPLTMGLWLIAFGGAAAVVILAFAVVAMERGGEGFEQCLHILNAIVLSLVALAVFQMDITPVIAVYFPLLLLLTTAYTLGARQAVLWGVPSIVLVIMTTLGPAPEPREISNIATLVVRIGVLGSVLVFGVFTRRSHDHQARELDRLANTDTLTGLANRMAFDRELGAALARADRSGATGAVVFVDIDGMKMVNDTYGHGVGDRFLCEIAERINAVTRSIDTPARIGGDEFVILLPEVNPATGSGAFTAKLMANLTHPWRWASFELCPAASIGVTTFSSGDSADKVLRRADHAMYEAKHAGGGHVVEHAAELER
ncbi:MAG: GGDEF domain-containing protein [Acidimicrobiales bacterium]|nr:GGDEF domain-containing protein [Acidimicrobiales bacterium]